MGQRKRAEKHLWIFFVSSIGLVPFQMTEGTSQTLGETTSLPPIATKSSKCDQQIRKGAVGAEFVHNVSTGEVKW